MEKSLDKYLEEITSAADVTGLVCSDAGGLCLAVKGSGRRENSGVICALAQQASKLHQELKEIPVICIESETGKTIINSQDGITLAINKTPS